MTGGGDAAGLAADERLRRGTVRLLTPDGGLAGTGFVVSCDGQLITCHHVVGDERVFAIVDSEGCRWTGTRCSTDAALHQSDFAILQLAAEPGRDFPPPLPMLNWAEPDLEVRSRVAVPDADAFRDTIPVCGRLKGPVKIVYQGRTDYSVRGQVIDGFRVESGMSGSVLWNDRVDAAIGVLAVSVGQMRNVDGFGILFAETPAGELVALAEANAGTIRRGGVHPNLLGLRRMLRDASENTIGRLCTRGIVLPDKFVPREGAEAALLAFLDEDKPSFPIISAAAQGKTSLMAWFASNPALPPSWLVRGADVKLGEAPAAALARLLADEGLDRAAAFASLAKLSGCTPLLLFDGLNEVPAAPQVIEEEWLPDLIGAARDAGWKLVFTTRRELFERLRKAPIAGHFFQPSSGAEAATGGYFFLGQYSAAEAEQAVASYRVPHRLSLNIGRHPMMIRFASDSGNPDDRRSHILRRVLDRFIGSVRKPGVDLHPAEMERLLVDMAARTNQLSGVLPFDDPLVKPGPFITALSDENILEEIAAGYRFVFDEIRDYLLALGLSRRIAAAGGHGGLGTAAYPPDPIALAIETLDGAGAAELAQAWAAAVARDCGTEASRQNALAVIAALPRSPTFDPIKRDHVDALLPMIDRGSYVFERERGLAIAFPPDAFDKVLRWAILQEGGYGWREKDIWSNWHRSTTVSFARMEFGAQRMVLELLDDDQRDGAAALIALLDDATHLANGTYREATVGSFALCMLWAHRHRIGPDRLFAEVILAGRKGADSLVDAFAEDEQAALMTMLEAVPRPTQVDAFPDVRMCWTALLRADNQQPELRLHARAADFFESLVGDLPLREVQEILLLVAAHGLTLDADVPALIRAMADQGVLSHLTLTAAVQVAWLDLDEGLAVAESIGMAQDFVWSVVGGWSPAFGPALADVTSLAARHLAGAPASDPTPGFAFERVARLVGLDEAEQSGFSALVEAVVRDGPEWTVHPLVYPAAGRGENSDARNVAFRDWLLGLLLRHPLAAETSSALLKTMFRSRTVIEDRRQKVEELVRREPVGALLQAIIFAAEGPDDELARLMAEAAASGTDRPAEHRQMLKEAAAILRRKNRAPSERRLALHELLMGAFRSARAPR